MKEVSMSNRTLIIYSSVYGQAEKIARRIADACAEWGVAAIAGDVRTIDANDLTQADVILVVASVHYGRHPRALVRFLTKHRVRLASRRTGLISVSGDAGDPATIGRAEEYVRNLFATTGWTAAEWHLAAGAVSFSKYNWFVRWAMKRSLVQRGVAVDVTRDREQTDWEDVLRFAKAFVTTSESRVA
jgi:menaquinone-dependent protoporphyrinogen oxidase